MMAVALKDRDMEADKMVREHHELAMEILRCLRGVGESGRAKISLFVDKAGEDAKGNTGRI